jgi:hypothetical protein
MSSIPWFADLADLSGVEKTFLFLAILIACFATGFVIDVIMKAWRSGRRLTAFSRWPACGRAFICAIGCSRPFAPMMSI